METAFNAGGTHLLRVTLEMNSVGCIIMIIVRPDVRKTFVALNTL